MALAQYSPDEEILPLNTVELVFKKLGLDTPISRGLAVFATSSALIMALKPEQMFDKNGAPLNWSATSESGTMIPWWMPGLVLGTACATLI